MGIPESQLETWSHQGATKTAQATHESIRYALTQYSFPDGVSYDAYLQGSYRNSTNIRGDSDVDVVVQLESVFSKDLSELDYAGKARFRLTYPTSATYTWPAFRSDVLKALRSYYGSGTVTEGNKSLKVAGNSSWLDADVVVCLTYRKYLSYPQYGAPRYIEGMTFWTIREWRQVINYPKLHYDKGAKKSDDTNQRFKPAVRMFKNARSYMVDKGMIDDKCAPSYFLECLVYNMPSSQFANSCGVTYLNFIQWFWQKMIDGQLNDLLCQNGVLPLFGSQAEQWSLASASRFVNHLWLLYKNW